MDQLWCRVSSLVAARTGLYFPPGRNSDLERALNAAAQEQGGVDVVAYATDLLSQQSPARLQMLVRHLTVGETYFWRDRAAFEALRSHVLPELLQARARQRELKLWSAACCTGEEAYSLAILVQQCVPQWQQWRITILGTDINGAFLQRAAAGIYSEWAFRGVPTHFKERYFTRTPEGRYAIQPQIKSMVRFATHNLVDEPAESLAGSAMDLILCRNVLMYLTPAQARKVIGNLRGVLSPQGWLAVGASECSHTAFREFTAMNLAGATLYRKDADGASVDAAQSEHAQPMQNITEAALPSAPTPAAPADFMKIYASAARLYQEQRYADVVDTLLVVPAANVSGNSQACALLTRALANIGRLDEALKWSRRWIAVEALDANAHYVRAMILQELGCLEDAQRALKEAIYHDPDLALAHVALGNLARSVGRTDQATKHFANALDSLRSAAHDTVLQDADGLTARQLQGILMSLVTPESAI